ncbi:SAM-dependent methyltransferase [Peterkaempfera sp. SMS 1(5)a]|uniref:SAM-dependent methyltransferase n=1 Tax=Peterkaempfera podocarpi TaxID=3232308 RepID=UPI0036711441
MRPDGGTQAGPPVDLRTDTPHSARIYDYLLGGKDHFPVDREAAERMLLDWPSLRTSAVQSRAFMHRAARYLAAEQGVRQFLDIGTGIPTEPNLHQIVQSVAPESRVVYVDNDPMVLVHARALFASAPEGRTVYVHADMRDPAGILKDRQLAGALDLDRPVALSVIAVMQFVTDDAEARHIVEQLTEPLAPGSFLAMSMVTADPDPEPILRVVREYNARGIPVRARDRARVEQLFGGLQLLDPGVVPVHHWRPDGSAPDAADAEVAMYCGIARKR